MNSQINLDNLVKMLQTRLCSNSKAKSTDKDGNTIYIDTDIYSVEMLETFIHLSVSNFNQVPHFTHFTLDDRRFVDVFAEALVEGATLYALASQSLIERGREFSMHDSGVIFNPPAVSELLNTQYSILLMHHWEKLQLIKSDIKNFSNW